ncbi:MAG: hypothetical protein V3R37_08870 [Rhodospirillales bacterium]
MYDGYSGLFRRRNHRWRRNVNVGPGSCRNRWDGTIHTIADSKTEAPFNPACRLQSMQPVRGEKRRLQSLQPVRSEKGRLQSLQSVQPLQSLRRRWGQRFFEMFRAEPESQGRLQPM